MLSRLHAVAAQDSAPGEELGAGATTAAVALVAIAATAVAGACGLLADASRILIYVLANFVLAFDIIDLVIRTWLKRLHGAAARGPSIDLGLREISNAERVLLLRPYAIVASVHDACDDIDRFMAMLAPLKDVVWLIDDASGDDTLLRLRREGWNCLAGGINRKKPGALAQLLKTLPPAIDTVLIIDPDIRWTVPPGQLRAVLEDVIIDLQRSGAAALTPRVRAEPGGWLEECQALEYELSCQLGRKCLGNLACNSGVSLYRRAALEAALSRHSLSVYAEDFENSLLLLAAGERIYYDDRLVIHTRAKPTWRSLFSQRVGWSFGCAKLFAERLSLIMAITRRSALGAYQYSFYLGVIGILLWPLKLLCVGILVLSALEGIDGLLMTGLLPTCSWADPMLFVLWYVKSAAVLLVTCLATLGRGERARALVALPFYGIYAMLQYIPTTVGYLNLITLRLAGRRLYADHYQPDLELRNAAPGGVP